MDISGRIYRSQPKKRCDKLLVDEPLVPTTMRYDNISRLKTEYNELLQKYSDFGIEATTKWYKEIRSTEIINPFEDYFLSLVNLCLTIKKNPILKMFCKAPFFTDTQDGVGTLDCDDVTTVERCYNYAKALFKCPKEQNASALYHDIIKEEMSYFQHLNHVFSKICNFYPFPTMMLDWTDDLEIAKSFYKNGEYDIFSIDFRKCSAFFEFGIKMYKDNSKPIQPQIIKAQNIYNSGIQSDALPENFEKTLLAYIIIQ